MKIENAGKFNRIEITDISGKIVRVIESPEKAVSGISLEGFSSGIYFIRLSSGRTIYTSRFIVGKSR